MKTWFSNKGQMVQTALAVIGCFFGGVKAWQDMHASDFFSPASIAFYLLIMLALTGGGMSIAAARSTSRSTESARKVAVIPGYSEFTRFTLPLGSYKNIELGRGSLLDRIHVELLEIRSAPMPGASTEKVKTEHRCVRLHVDGFVPFIGQGAVEVLAAHRPFEVILFEFKSSRMMMPSMVFDFRPRKEGFAFVALVVEHINVEEKTAELGVYGTDLWAAPTVA